MNNSKFMELSNEEIMEVEGGLIGGGGVKWYWYVVAGPAGALVALAVDVHRLGYSNGKNSTRR